MGNEQHHCVLSKRSGAAARLGRGHRAFTLMELVVVTIMLAILSGAIVLRATSNVPRRARVVIGQIDMLLETLAHRQMVSQDRLALAYDQEAGVLWLESLRREVDADDDDVELSVWTRDPLAPNIIFDDEIRLSFIRLDGEIKSDSFRFEFPMDEIRPLIEIEVTFDEFNAIVVLLPQSSRTEHLGFGATEELLPEPFDLDRAGMGDEEW